MPDKKFKTPNGQIVSESELRGKYGDKFSSLVSNNTFSEVSEPVYKTPNGKYEVESVLKNKYGSKFNELSKNSTFVLDETPVKKKDTPLSTAPTESMELEQKVGSSVSQKSKGFPEIEPVYDTLPDTRELSKETTQQKEYRLGKELSKVKVTPQNMDEVSRKTDELSSLQKTNKQEALDQKYKYAKAKELEEVGGLEYSSKSLTSGIATALKGVASTPKLAYNAAAFFTNPIMKAIGYEGEEASADKLAKDYGLTNYAIKGADEIIKSAQGKIEKYEKQNGGDALTALENGNLVGAAKIVSGQTLQSLPNMILAMASGGSTASLATIGTTTASLKYDELENENPELSQGAKLSNALVSGGLEAFMGHFISGTSGAIIKGILKEKGAKEGAKIITNSFKKTAQNVIEKSPMVGFFGEMLEESLVEFGNQANDIATGTRAEFDMRAIKNAGISATGLGGIQTAGIYGVKAYVNQQTKNQVKKANNAVLSLQKDLENPNLSEEQKATINTSIKDIYAKNKQVLGEGLKKFQAIPESEKVELLKIDDDIDELQSQAIEIKHSNDISEESKAVLLDNLKSKALQANNRKEEILSKSPKINFAELPLKEQETIKKQAMESLVTELNPDGKKDMTITDQMVTKRANEIYTESNLNEKQNAKIEVSTAKTEAKTEVQKQPEAEKVAEVSPEVADVEKRRKEELKDTLYRTKDFQEEQILIKEINAKYDAELESLKTKETPKPQEVSPLEDVVAPSVEQESLETALIEPKVETEVVETAQVETTELTPLEKAKQARLEAKAKLDAKRNAPKEEVVEPKVETPKVEKVAPKNAKQELESITNEDVAKVEKESKNNTKTVPEGKGNWRKVFNEERDAFKKSAILRRIAEKSTDENELLDIKEASKGMPEESNILNEVDNRLKTIQKNKPQTGKVITPNEAVKVEADVVKSELKLDDVDGFIYDELNDTPDDLVERKAEDLKDKKLGEIDAIDEEINQIDKDLEDNDRAIDDINEDEKLTPAKRKKALAEKEKIYKDLAKKQEDLEDKKKATKDFIEVFESRVEDEYGDFTNQKIKEVTDKVNNRLATRKAVKEGTDLFPETANIPELETEIKSTNDLKKHFSDSTVELIEGDIMNEDYSRESLRNYVDDLIHDNEVTGDVLSEEKLAPSKLAIKEISKYLESIEQPKAEKSKVESAKEKLKEATAKRKETKAKLDAKKRNQGIASDPKQDAQDLYDYHQALVAEAKEYIKLGVATLSEFADALGEKVSISVKQAWDEAKGTISPITKGEDLSYDFTSMNNEVKEVKEAPKKEPKQAEKPKVAPKKEVAEETVTKKAKDLGITDSQYEGLRDKAKALPQSGEFSEYLSGETIEDVYDDKARNEQGYEVTKLQQLTDHGVAFLDKAKDLFGGDYVAKTLDFLHNSNLNTFEKGVIYASLVNEMDTLNKNFPDDMEFKKLQDAVYADYQANLRVGSLTINTGRLIRILNAIKTGVEVAGFTSKLYTPQQKEAKTILENAVPTPERLNVVTENEKLYTQEELDTEIQKAKDKETFERLKRQVRKETRAGKKENLANEKAKIINELRALARKQLGKLSANPIPLDAIPLMYKLAKVSIKQGALTVEEVVDDVYNSLKDIYQNINKNDVKFVLENEPAEVEKDFKQPKLQEVVKQALIDAGFSREIKNNKTGDVRQVIDWTKLFGRAGTIESLKTKVEEQLKAQGKTDAEIAEIQTQLYEEYKRLSELIVDKAIADLERRNLVKPSPHRKSNAKRLADLYEQGLFDANLDKYENIVNAILGFSKTSQETFDKIKEKVKALSDLYAEQSDGRVLSELEITTQSNKIKRAINVLFFNSVMKEAPTHAKLALANLQFGLWSLRSLLGGIKTLTENRISGELQVVLSDLAFGKNSTKELRELNKKAQEMVSRDIRLYGAQPYGDTSMSLLAHSIIDDVINEKIITMSGHQAYNILTLRTFLDAVDSSVKVRLTNKHFVENAINVLMTNSDTRKAMTRKEAVQFVSEALTGDNFKKAEETAKNVIDEVNAKAGKKILKDNPEAIFRFAMDIVNKNLNNDNVMTMSEIEASFKAGIKSAGASIGHESNNWLTGQFNAGSQRLSNQLDKAITEQNWLPATLLAITSLIVKTTATAFKGGGSNWIVIGADKGIPLFGIGHALARYKWDKNYKINLDTETGRKGLEHSLYLQGQYRDTMMRGIYAVGIFAIAAASMGYKGDDEETNAFELMKWLNIPKNKWLKKYFYKIAPASFSAFVAYESGIKEMPEYFGRMFDVGNDYYDKGVQLKRSIGSKQEGSTKEVLGKIATAPYNLPAPWKIAKDIEEIGRGLQGLKPIEEEKSKKGFVKGMFKGGGLEYLGGLTVRIYDKANEEEEKNKKTPN